MKEKKTRIIVESLNLVEWTSQHMVKKRVRTNFNKAWFLTVIINANNKFHHNFQVGYRVHPIGYRGV
jgi:hypothetical protein